eukprot:6334342-Karenia_brevis.AAC.1
MDDQPLSELELSYATHKCANDGLEVFTYLDGLPSSSSRAELLGLIMGCYTPGPAHIALDNLSVVRY